MSLSWYTKMRLYSCSLERRASRLICWVLSYLHGPFINRSWFMSIPRNTYYRNFIMQQDKKFNWSPVQMYDIRFWAMCAHHSCPFITTDQALIATILDATAVKTSAHKCFRCGSFNHLVDGCPFPQAASLETAEMTKKGIGVRQTAKPGPFKSTSPTQTDRWKR